MIRRLVPQPYPATGGSQYNRANSLFLRARGRARRGQFWSRLTGRSRALYPLKQLTATCTVHAQRDGVVRTIPISQIRGSEGRSRYFDCDFNPLCDQARWRWLNIAKARQQGKPLPPVALVQVGDVYFVQDGHHRISVARALGQRDVEARVTIWQVNGPLPLEMPARARSAGRRAQPQDTGRAFRKLQQALLDIQSLLAAAKTA
jgi:hypothetical protein